jgi:hypothetical protein
MNYVNDLTRPFPAYPYFCGDVQTTLVYENFSQAYDLEWSVLLATTHKACTRAKNKAKFCKEAKTYFYLTYNSDNPIKYEFSIKVKEEPTPKNH